MCTCTEDKEVIGNVIIGRNKVTCQECLDRYAEEQAKRDAEEQRIANRLLSRYQWENYYIEQCRLLGLPDVATTEQIQAALEAQSATALANSDVVGAMNALKKGVEMLGIINAITQNGGNWESISYHPEVVEDNP
jgi:hypothetical protein